VIVFKITISKGNMKNREIVVIEHYNYIISSDFCLNFSSMATNDYGKKNISFFIETDKNGRFFRRFFVNDSYTSNFNTEQFSPVKINLFEKLRPEGTHLELLCESSK
jgi:hypothetical protein